MSIRFRSLLPIALGSLFVVNSFAQTTSPPKEPAKKAAVTQKAKKPPAPTTKELSAQVETLQDKLDQAQTQIQQQQGQIEHLHQSLQESINALQQEQQQLRASVQKANDEVVVARNAAVEAGSQVTAVKTSVEATQTSLVAQDKRVKNLEDPIAIRYKGLRITPGGFVESTIVVRTRNENADIANSYAGVPLNGSPNSKLTEFRGSVRDSRLSLMVQGNAGSTELAGYFELDFMGAAPTANYVQTASFTPRVRQAWLQARMDSGWTFGVGQMWTLLTTNRHGIANKAEFIPDVDDCNYMVGYTWARDRSLRVTKNFHDKFWAAVEVDDPENVVSAAYMPPNLMGLNTSPNTQSGTLLLPYLANYSFGNSTTMAPDLIAKVAWEPGWGHFEAKALGRFFRDRVSSTATTHGHNNFNEGWGVGFGAIMPVNRKVDVIAEGLLGYGIGRYSSGQFADVTLSPTSGGMLPLREAHLLSGIEYHPNNRWKLWTYFGDEYAGRRAFVSPTGTAAGYGSPLVSYATCYENAEVSMNSCSGANRNIYEGSVGYWYRLYQGEFGWIQYGNSVAYIHRDLWNGIGRTPQGQDLAVFSTVRFYLP